MGAFLFGGDEGLLPIMAKTGCDKEYYTAIELLIFAKFEYLVHWNIIIIQTEYFNPIAFW